MEPGPPERHESDTTAVPTSADGPDVADNPGAWHSRERETTAPVDGGVPSTPAGGESVAPKPRTRRGWMSDSPLDGGSGWPTSAYAIIRRPEGYLSANGSSPATTKPASTKPATTKPATTQNGAEPPVDEHPKIGLPRQASRHLGRAGNRGGHETTEGATRAEPTDGAVARTPRGLAIAGALVVLVALALVVFFAVRANRTDTQQPVSSAPTRTANLDTVAEPESSSAVSFAPEATTTAMTTTTATSVAGDVLRAGSVRLSIGPDRADESFDFDSGIKGASAGEQQPDLHALTQGLWAAHGAHVALWTQPGSPTAAGCRALPSADWTSVITVEPGLNGPTVCVQTSEGRVASFVARPIDIGPDGGVQTVYLDFTVWKKAGD
jgi:hypothetical protein